MRLNKEQKAFSAVDPESVGFNRLQFKSPKMKTGLLCDRAEIKELFNSSSKVSERRVWWSIYSTDFSSDCIVHLS